MGRPRNERPKGRYHVSLSPDNWDWLTETFGKNVGISTALDSIITSYRKRIDARAAASATPLQMDQVDDLPELAGLEPGATA